MTKPRILETNNGIQDELDVQMFNQFVQTMHRRGFDDIQQFLESGIEGGDLLDIGSGPGYVGITLAKKLSANSLTACELSPAMIHLAQENASKANVKANYILANAMKMPFDDASFDSIISHSSLHEWEDPIAVFNEIYRLLRPGGHYCITDLRRDVHPIKKALIYYMVSPKGLRPGYLSSMNAAYTLNELNELLRQSCLENYRLSSDFFGLTIAGQKNL